MDDTTPSVVTEASIVGTHVDDSKEPIGSPCAIVHAASVHVTWTRTLPAAEEPHGRT